MVTEQDEPPPLRAALTFQSTVNIIAYSLLALHTITFDQMLPVLMSYPREDPSVKRGFLKFAGGFGMPSSRVGFFFSLYGVIGMFLQVSYSFLNTLVLDLLLQLP